MLHFCGWNSIPSFPSLLSKVVTEVILEELTESSRSGFVGDIFSRIVILIPASVTDSQPGYCQAAAHVRFDDLDLDSRSQRLGRGKDSAMNHFSKYSHVLVVFF